MLSRGEPSREGSFEEPRRVSTADNLNLAAEKCTPISPLATIAGVQALLRSYNGIAADDRIVGLETIPARPRAVEAFRSAEAVPAIVPAELSLALTSSGRKLYLFEDSSLGKIVVLREFVSNKEDAEWERVVLDERVNLKGGGRSKALIPFAEYLTGLTVAQLERLPEYSKTGRLDLMTVSMLSRVDTFDDAARNAFAALYSSSFQGRLAFDGELARRTKWVITRLVDCDLDKARSAVFDSRIELFRKEIPGISEGALFWKELKLLPVRLALFIQGTPSIVGHLLRDMAERDGRIVCKALIPYLSPTDKAKICPLN